MQDSASDCRKNFRKAMYAFPTGMPIPSKLLTQWGVSRQLAHWYKRNGWLEPFGQGYYLRAGDTVTETGAVAALESNGVLVHLGGKTALVLRGFSHYLPIGESKVYLCGRNVRKVPRWFTEHFVAELSSGKLFHENDQLDNRMCVTKLSPHAPYSPHVSDPERAILEVLDNVPLRQTLGEARLIMEGMLTLNPEKIQKLLTLCTKIKVKRLFLTLAREIALPVLKELDCSSVNCGAATIYTIQNSKGHKSLTLKNPLNMLLA